MGALELGAPGIGGAEGALEVDVRLREDAFAHRYFPASRTIELGNPLGAPAADAAVPKIPPTLIHHEFAHHVIAQLTGSRGDESIHEGLADALASLTAGTPLLGFVSADARSADPQSRDLRDPVDLSSPSATRHVIAGALWASAERLARLDAEVGIEPSARSTALLTVLATLARLGSTEPALDPRSLPAPPILLRELALAHRQLGRPEPNADWVAEILRWEFGGRSVGDQEFMRGDAQGNARLGITDAVQILAYGFLSAGEIPSCADAYDADDDGEIRITDAIVVLRHLFLSGPELPDPFPNCGERDPTPDHLSCAFHSACGDWPR